MTHCNLRPNCALDQKVEENRPMFLFKMPIFQSKLNFLKISKAKKDPPFLYKKGVCFLQLFDLNTPKASNCDPTAHGYFTRNHSYKNSFKQCKISYNLIKLCQIRELNVSTES